MKNRFLADRGADRLLALLRLPIVAAALCAGSTAMAQTSHCESLRSQIDGKFKAGGGAAFRLTIVDAGSTVTGRIVGSCDRGSKRIVYEPLSASTASAARVAAPAAVEVKPRPQRKPKPRTDAVLTECRDGTVTRGDCP